MIFCDEFDYRNEVEENVLNHKIAMHTNHYCNKCGFVTESVAELMNHLHDKHNMNNSQSNQSKCKRCNLSFSSLSELHTHIRTHDRINNRTNHFGCNYCGFKAISLQALDVHIQSFHKIYNSRRANSHSNSFSRNPSSSRHTTRLENGICRSWSNGTCNFNDSCKYAHIRICNFQENCRFQSNCRFFHFSKNNLPFLCRMTSPPQTFQLRNQEFPPLQSVNQRG